MNRKEEIAWALLGIGFCVAAWWSMDRHYHPLTELLILGAFSPWIMKRIAR